MTKNFWLIVNGFIKSDKFNEIYGFFAKSANKRQLNIEIKSSLSFANVLNQKQIIQNPPDFIIFWDKDILLAERLESQNIPLFNCSKAISICDDKAKTALILDKSGIGQPNTIIAPKTFFGVGYTDLSFIDNAIEKLGLPLIIKESFGSFGQQVYLANDKQQAIKIITTFSYRPFIMQKFISNSAGRDIRVNVVGNKVISSMMRYNENDFRSNVTIGGRTERIELNDKQKQIAIDACVACGLDFAGVDVLFGDKETPLICEINSNPHFKSTLDCTGVDLSDTILDYVLTKI